MSNAQPRNGDELLDREQLKQTAEELGRCASSWVCNARLVGNVPAGEIMQLCMEFVLLAENAEELQAKLAELEKPCVWTYDEIHDKWDTSCGNAFQFMDSGPNDNECKFCCYCGHPLT